ncbi:fumarate reductase [Methylacidiphilum kamchatkense Kam1]|uniref:Fumarate reductase n=1 Tax=Methylacidiphilum kamchatkense Kam1 TaxID=1202785 RepID=A0A0C1RVY1_9BACT|nr:succinate dehydrogenase/fumarate reductase iron-sulfur subunit [Methylacidiphilum kamchatkense]KIE59081.1 fumarate reductase [Methylacidiphilum kamchatkense Kam1]QDQ43007.1 succinate dehydrogenase / fumarate reductase iron-sulfur subunit [Methylacidiphilum kamchatkense Kam1]
MKIRLKIWRQPSRAAKGDFVFYALDGLNPNMSFLEMLDYLNEKLISEGQEPVAFDSDCREGICGSCSLMINGKPHGPGFGITTCQLYLRQFQDDQEIIVEPFRSRAFPVIKDLIVDRSALDRIMQAGGFISTLVGQAPEANSIAIPHDVAEKAFDAAHCIGCGACVAVCKNSSASLFVGAKIAHLSLLPQGQPERRKRVLQMVRQADKEGFGACSFTKACEAVCPKAISVEVISRMYREYLTSAWMQKLGWIN